MKPIVVAMLICLLSGTASAQKPDKTADLKLTGTRSWIKVEWKSPQLSDQMKVYWSSKDKKPELPSAIIDGSKNRYYIEGVKEETRYFIWVDGYANEQKQFAAKGSIVTTRKWELEPNETKNIDMPSSTAVPEGMELYWHDEFNDDLLNRNKWFTQYYSTIDYLRKENWEDLRQNSLPEAAYRLNGSFIDLFVNDSLPLRPFSGGKKISSIQTYNWSTNENLLDNSKGGYFEVRVRRGSTGRVKGLNTAFWFDSPGPDLKYYLQQGTTIDGVDGIRPSGQLFEIDMFEYLTAQFVMHGIVDTNGQFVKNLATDIAHDYDPKKYEPGKEWVTFGLLWTPTAIKHYINGKLIKSYDDVSHIYSPNHFMNVFLGSYGEGGTVNMEVDYIRYYRWPINEGNELANGGAEFNSNILPWEGSASVTDSISRRGHHSFLLKSGQTLTQYIYLDHSKKYDLNFWHRGKGTLQVEVNNLIQVTGVAEDSLTKTFPASNSFSKQRLVFKTGKEQGINKKTIRIHFTNNGSEPVFLDEISLKVK